MAASVSVSVAVGSSSSSTFAFSDSARAISTRCFCPGDSEPSGVCTSMPPPTRSSALDASR